MTIEPRAQDPLKMLEEHLSFEALIETRRATFDMFDGPEADVLAPFVELHNAIKLLETKITQPWREADEKAQRSHLLHKRLARTAIVTGTAAIVFAIVQLSMKLTWPQATDVALILEAIAVIAAFAAVAVGLTAKFDRKWLGHRHLAEQLRMLKFRALEELWRSDPASWHKWVDDRLDELKGAHNFPRVKQWSEEGEVEPYDPFSVKTASDSRFGQALTIYYRFKRLDFQASYFKTRHDTYTEKTVGWRHLNLPIFLVSVLCVLAHFATEFRVRRLEAAGNEAAAEPWHDAGIWLVALAAVIPVLGLGIRSWFAAFELPRSASLFAAKHRALVRASAHLKEDLNNLPAVLRHMSQVEHFLENEHREWLRLLLDTEWFL